MITINDLIFAIDETQKKLPQNTFEGTYAGIIGSAPDALLHITSRNNARQTIAAATVNEIVKVIAEEIVKIYTYGEVIKKTDPEYANQPTFKGQYNVLIKKCPGYELVNSLVRTFKNPSVNAIAYLLTDNKSLLDALHIIDRYYYSYDKQYRDILAKYGSGARIIDPSDILNKIEQDAAKLEPVTNVRINMRAVNKCYDEVIRGIQVRNRRNDYALSGNMFATQHVGNKRSNQEDSVLIMEHPANPEFKVLVVSDGMGGGKAGEVVSTYTVQQIARWFESLDPSLYENPKEVQRLFNAKIDQISLDIYNKFNYINPDRVTAGATFTGAVVTKDQTVITQIGDSRAYVIKNGDVFRRENISLVTVDDSLVWPTGDGYRKVPATEANLPAIEDSKYHKRSNAIFRCIGDYNVSASTQSFMIPNNGYDKLLLMSDGASDLLSFEGIKIICRNTPWEKITNYLVHAALIKNAIRGKEWDGFYEKFVAGELTQPELDAYNSQVGIGDETHYDHINAGKDNTTVAGYFRR